MNARATMGPVVALMGGLLVVALVSLVAACGSEPEEPTGGFIDTKPSEFSMLADWDFPGDGSLADIVAAADAVVVAEVVEIVSLDYSGPGTEEFPEDVPPEAAEIMRRGLPHTTYRIAVQQWLKGDGPAETTITDLGGMTPEGPRYASGDFLLEEGRTYLTTLMPTHPLQLGEGVYSRTGGCRGSFEVTDGLVHVLNDPMCEDLQELYGGMSLAEFVEVVEGFVGDEGAEQPAP